MGFFSNQTAQAAACKKCITGQFNDEQGQTYCKSCPPGEYAEARQSGDTVNSCRLCKAGTYNDEAGLVECKECLPGTYNEKEGSNSSSDCVQCPEDSNGRAQTSVRGSSSVESCSAKEITCNIDPAQRPINYVCTLCPQGFHGNGKGTGCVS